MDDAKEVGYSVGGLHCFLKRDASNIPMIQLDSILLGDVAQLKSGKTVDVRIDFTLNFEKLLALAEDICPVSIRQRPAFRFKDGFLLFFNLSFVVLIR